MIIRTPTLGRAHELAVKAVLKYGQPITTEDGEETLEIPEPLMVHVGMPFMEPKKSKHSPYGESYSEEYIHSILHHKPDNGFAYTYHDRLFRHNVPGTDILIDQIAMIKEKLKNNQLSRRAQAITWYSGADLSSTNPPCLQRVQYLIRPIDNVLRLNAYADFRSNDILMAFGENILALTALQSSIASELGIAVGTYTHVAVSAHIYHIRDSAELERMKNAF